ncbi:Rieske 2Fe-2S domain-containing protein [Pseudenhygromyxa sp. WMMC2535]|uniref:Rieske 2Fe-2S domain-containing protein n=1 Tax=Pseudenhygromyxa sp. WMMC2535 TaxID=2712867 RepID=UPI0015544F59|nr:Rieske 2Fe-2S domain-containing protein [Pseudenhygromyxa sp. WMMC2535]NVB40937.1 Rieske 2Fe-2S domain-containing protein [Pseudenhygromyxa sp. WMMC2535]
MQEPLSAPPQARFPFPTLPSGWFVVATSEELAVGELIELRYFGRDLVAFRGESGRVTVLDAYCPHLGAHFAHGGKIEGDCVRCPFHLWKFDAQGTCVEVPYSDRIPPKASVEAWPTLEQDGLVFVFHGQPGEQPWALPEFGDEGYTPARMVHWRDLATHPQEIFENTVDITHIGPIHNGRQARLMHKPKREGVHLNVNLEFHAPGDIVGMPDQLNDVHLDVNLYGLGAVIVFTHVRNVDVHARQRLYVTPVDESHVDIRGIVQVREGEDPEFTKELAEVFFQAYVDDFAKDFPIWENKRYLTRPVLAKGDGPIGIYRRWCTQFYADPQSHHGQGDDSRRSDATPQPATAPRAAAAPPPPEPAEQLIGRDSLLRRVAGSIQAAVPGSARTLLQGARDPARALVGDVRERLPWLAAPLSTLDALLGHPPSHAPEASAPNEFDLESDEEWQPTPASASPTPSQPAPTANGGGGPRVANVDEYFQTLPQRFVPKAAKGVDAVFQWELGGAEGRTFHARVRDGAIDPCEGPHPEPTVTLAMDAHDYIQVVNGELDGMRAFTSGRGKVKGSVRVAMKMQKIFPGA